MNIDEYFAEQVEKVRAGVANPATRKQFLAEWFNSEPARIIGQNPTIRGNFARLQSTECRFPDCNGSVSGSNFAD
jgi:hypothetical protein